MTSHIGRDMDHSTISGISSGADAMLALERFDDDALIRMAVAGRHDCFSLLMDRHLTAVRKRVRLLIPNEADLDDVLQDVLLKVWRHLSSFRSESSLRTWMIRVAINQSREIYRRRKHDRLSQPIEDYKDLTSPGTLQDELIAQDELSSALRCAIAGLPPKYREVLTLRDLRQQCGDDTARQLRLTVEAVKTRLYRARILLSTMLLKSGAVIYSSSKRPKFARGNGGAARKRMRPEPTAATD